MATLFKTIVNCETGETTQEPLTQQDLAAIATDKVEADTKRAAIQLAADTKASAIAKLTSTTYQPLTKEEAATVVI